MNYARYVSRKATPQSEPIPGREPQMVENAAGGFAFKVSPWTRLDRFLVLGSEGGTYYVSERKLTRENAASVLGLLQTDARRVIDRVVEISDSGRAPKNDPALFVLALAAKLAPSAADRRHAFDQLPKVARIGTHLLHFVSYINELGGWGRATRTGIQSWFLQQPPLALAYQMLKYRERDGFSMRDVLRLAHPKGTVEHNVVFEFVAKREEEPAAGETDLALWLDAARRCRLTTDAAECAALVREHNLTREFVNPELRGHATVLAALLKKMPLGALVRNLGVLGKAGVLTPMSQVVPEVVGRLTDADAIRKARIHPFGALLALRTYASGRGFRGTGEWPVVPQVVDALEAMFYSAFRSVTPTGKRTLLALDVSGSMSVPIQNSNVSCCEATAAMAMVTARTEPTYHVMAFADKFRPLPLTAGTDLRTAIDMTSRQNFGGTDCSLPMIWAERTRTPVDTFVVYTDNETWAGDVHPAQALARYRQRLGIAAKLIVVGMTATEVSIADPDDAGMMDVVGFDAAAPEVIADFSRE